MLTSEFIGVKVTKAGATFDTHASYHKANKIIMIVADGKYSLQLKVKRNPLEYVNTSQIDLIKFYPIQRSFLSLPIGNKTPILAKTCTVNEDSFIFSFEEEFEVGEQIHLMEYVNRLSFVSVDFQRTGLMLKDIVSKTAGVFTVPPEGTYRVDSKITITQPGHYVVGNHSFEVKTPESIVFEVRTSLRDGENYLMPIKRVTK